VICLDGARAVVEGLSLAMTPTHSRLNLCHFDSDERPPQRSTEILTA
jgi:hypothetical protein